MTSRKSAKITAIIFAVILQNIAINNSFAGNVQSVDMVSIVEGKGPVAKYNRGTFFHGTEYPLSSVQSIGGTLQASYTNFKQDPHLNSTSEYSLNAVEIFHRYKFFTYKKLSITVGNLYKFPGIYNENPALGFGPKQSDYELRFFFGYNMQDRMTNQVIRGTNTFFIRPEIAYRRRFSNPFDEIRFFVTAGLKLHPKYLLLLQDNIIWNVASKASMVNNSYSNPTNFDFSKDAINIGTLSLVYRCSNEIAVQVGYVKRLHGNAIQYDSRGIVAGLWTSF